MKRTFPFTVSPPYSPHTATRGGDDQKVRAFTLIDPRRSLSRTPIRDGDDKRVQGFTLIELLIVIAIIAILSVVVVLSLNPQEMLRKGRDSNRVSDLDTLTHAISLYQADQGTSGSSGFLGTSTIIYVSLPDSSSTCGSWNLPTPPTSTTYQCASPQTYRNTNGQGWIPLNFQTITTGSPLGQLPIDPTNASSTGLYYTYTTNGTQYELTSLFESSQYKAQYAQNPAIPNYPEVNAKGSNLTLNPLWNPQGLVGYWNLDEGTGTLANDMSGNGNGGTWQGTLGGQWTTGKVGGGGNFNGTDNYINIGSSNSLQSSNFGGLSVFGWVKFNLVTTGGALLMKNGDYGMRLNTSSGVVPYFTTSVNGWGAKSPYSYPFQTGVWYLVGFTYANGTENIFFNGTGVLSSNAYSGSLTGGSGTTQLSQVLWDPSVINGQIDDVRVYNRALSAAEVIALYNAEK